MQATQERSRRIFERLEQDGRKQRWLARMLGVSDRDITLWKYGYRMPAHQQDAAERLLGLDSLTSESLPRTEEFREHVDAAAL